MPFIRDAHTKPIRCSGHLWWPEGERERCSICKLVYDPRSYGFGPTKRTYGTPLGSPLLQVPNVVGTTMLRAGDNALSMAQDMIEARQRGAIAGRGSKTRQNGWIHPNLAKNASKRPNDV